MIKFFTIGHSNHSLEQFIHLLEENGVVMMLVDVRTAPYSRYNPHFNEEDLEAALREHDIQYAYAASSSAAARLIPTVTKAAVYPPKAQTTCTRSIILRS